VTARLPTLQRAVRVVCHWGTFIVSAEARRHAKVGPASVWKEKRHFQIHFLREHGLRSEDYFLDIGCGTLRGGIPIIEFLEPEHYVGIDARAEVLDDARAELHAHHLEDKRPRLVATSDLAPLDLGRRFDVIWAFAVLIHMSDEVLDDALDFVGRHLEAGGVFYANVTTEERSDKVWEGFPDVARPISFYEQHAAAHGFSVENLGSLHSLGHAHGHGESQQMLRFTGGRRKDATASPNPGRSS
jgi:SAM-dependent methyltransferase